MLLLLPFGVGGWLVPALASERASERGCSGRVDEVFFVFFYVFLFSVMFVFLLLSFFVRVLFLIPPKVFVVLIPPLHSSVVVMFNDVLFFYSSLSQSHV